MGVATERGQDQTRDHGQQDDPPREREPVAAEGELAGHEAVLRQDRCQPREGVEAGVGGQEQDQRGACLEREVERGPVAEDGGGSLRDHGRAARVRVGRPDVERVGDQGDADEQYAQQDRHHDQRVGGVARLGRLERGDAVGDRFGPGQGDRSARERLQ